jgi:hypothetical protein
MQPQHAWLYRSCRSLSFEALVDNGIVASLDTTHDVRAVENHAGSDCTGRLETRAIEGEALGSSSCSYSCFSSSAHDQGDMGRSKDSTIHSERNWVLDTFPFNLNFAGGLLCSELLGQVGHCLSSLDGQEGKTEILSWVSEEWFDSF